MSTMIYLSYLKIFFANFFFEKLNKLNKKFKTIEMSFKQKFKDLVK